MELDIHNLKRILDLIFEHLSKDLNVSNVPIEADKDFYWEVPTENLFDVRKDQPRLDIGRLSDDWDFLQRMAEKREEAVSLMLIHVAPLLQHIGQKIGQ